MQFILDRKRFSQKDNEDFAFGIERLLHDRVYTAAYPLHDVSKLESLLKSFSKIFKRKGKKLWYN